MAMVTSITLIRYSHYGGGKKSIGVYCSLLQNIIPPKASMHRSWLLGTLTALTIVLGCCHLLCSMIWLGCNAQSSHGGSPPSARFIPCSICHCHSILPPIYLRFMKNYLSAGYGITSCICMQGGSATILLEVRYDPSLEPTPMMGPFRNIGLSAWKWSIANFLLSFLPMLLSMVIPASEWLSFIH